MSNHYKMGKKIALGVAYIAILFLATTAVLSAVEITPAEIILNVDYGSFVDEDRAVIRRNFDLPIRNTEGAAVSISITVTGLPSRYNVPAISTITIPPGETRTVTVAIDVPHQERSGRKQIGVIEIKDTASNTIYDTAVLIQDTKTMLTIDELEIDYEDADGETEQQTFNGDDSSIELDESVRPGSQVTIAFKDIENLFDENYERDSSDIEDITLTIEADDDDIFKGDFEEEYSLSALAAEDHEDFEVAFAVDEQADEGKYVLTIELVGEDGEGAKHSIETKLTLEIERNKDDIRIFAFKLSPERPSACEERLVINTEIKNIGTRSQNDVTIQLHSPSLGITQNVPNLNLNRFSKDGSSYSHSFYANLAAESPAPGSRHDLEFNVFLDDKKIDHQRKSIILGECNNQSATETAGAAAEENGSIENNQNNNPAAADEQPTAQVISSGQIVRTVEDPYSSEDVLVSLIIISIILLLAVIAIFTVIIIKNKSEVSPK